MHPPSFSYDTGKITISLPFCLSTVVGRRVVVLSSGWPASYSGSVGRCACINNYGFVGLGIFVIAPVIFFSPPPAVSLAVSIVCLLCLLFSPSP